MPDEKQESAARFVSRAGIKLEHALREFDLEVTGSVCADFGCNIGGFTDCLLQHGAEKVFAIDTGYGMLAYKLRMDSRVVAMERTNVLHAESEAAVDLVVIDLAWTSQRFSIPVACQWLKPSGHILTLVKPHYELTEQEKESLLIDGRLDPGEAGRVLKRVQDQFPSWGAEPIGQTQSPISGGKSSRKKHGSGNVEFFVLARPIQAPLEQAK